MSDVAWLLVQLAFFVWLLFTLAREWAWLLLAGVLAVKLAPVLQRKNAAQRGAERQRKADLVKRADEEHAMVLRGDAAGVYGQYPPPAPIWGMGIWMVDGDRRDRVA